MRSPSRCPDSILALLPYILLGGLVGTSITLPICWLIPPGPATSAPAPARIEVARLDSPASATAPIALTIEATAYGAKADGTDAAPGIQAALDAMAKGLAGAGTWAKGTVHLAGAATPYVINAPIYLDASNIDLVGDGNATKLQVGGQAGFPMLVMGLRRTGTVNGVTLDAGPAFRPDLFGRLDASAAPSPGKRHGFRSCGTSILVSQGSAFSHGGGRPGQYYTDNWTTTKGLTVEVALEGFAAGMVPASPSGIFGAGVPGKPVAYPLNCYSTGPNQFAFQFSTQAVPRGPSQTWTGRFSTAAATGVQRLAFQVDLVNGVAGAYAGGVQVYAAANPAWVNTHFLENDYYPFEVGELNGSRPNLTGNNNFDIGVYGLLYSKTLRYQAGAVGSVQQSATGATLNDSYRYFCPPANDPAVVGFFNFTEDPSTSPRCLSVAGGGGNGGYGSSAFLLNSSIGTLGPTQYQGVRDLYLGGGRMYGACLGIGQTLDTRVSGLRCEGTLYGVADLLMGANYTQHFDRCTLDGLDSAYFGQDQTVWIRDLTILNSGRVALRFAGCNVDLELGTITYPSPWNQFAFYAHAGDYGGKYVIRGLNQDFEGSAYLAGGFGCERTPYGPTSLRLQDVNFQGLGPVPFLVLRDGLGGNASYPPATFAALNCFTGAGPGSSIVSVDTPLWSGSVAGSYWAPGATPLVRVPTYPGPANVTVAP